MKRDKKYFESKTNREQFYFFPKEIQINKAREEETRFNE